MRGMSETRGSLRVICRNSTSNGECRLPIAPPIDHNNILPSIPNRCMLFPNLRTTYFFYHLTPGKTVFLVTDVVCSGQLRTVTVSTRPRTGSGDSGHDDTSLLLQQQQN